MLTTSYEVRDITPEFTAFSAAAAKAGIETSEASAFALFARAINVAEEVRAKPGLVGTMKMTARAKKEWAASLLEKEEGRKAERQALSRALIAYAVSVL